MVGSVACSLARLAEQCHHALVETLPPPSSNSQLHTHHRSFTLDERQAHLLLQCDHQHGHAEHQRLACVVSRWVAGWVGGRLVVERASTLSLKAVSNSPSPPPQPTHPPT